jgi:membrane peptidoglycan carboxypeptidase
VLRGVQEPGGFGYQYGQTNLTDPATGAVIPSAGKTGTTQDGKSVWFVGYTPQIATAAMIAGATKDGQRPMELAGQVIHGTTIYEVTGSGFAGPMWAQAMHAIEGSLDIVNFTPPALTAIQGDPTLIPSVSGMSVEEAESTLEAAGFNALDGGITASSNPAGTVAYSSPSGGTTAPEGSVVTYYESSGTPPPPTHTGGGGHGGGGHGGGGHGGGHHGGGGR